MKTLFLFLVGRLVAIGMVQLDFVPENLVGLLLQLPLVGLIVWLQLQNQKWFERMLSLHDESVKEIYAKNQVLVNDLLGIMQCRQVKMLEAVGLLEKQIDLFRANLSEIVELEDLVGRILEKIK